MKLALLFSGALALFAQQPHVSNARLETRPVTGGLEAAFQAILKAQAAPAWVGYAEPIIPGDRQICWPQTVKLEGPTHLVILLRVENNQTSKIHTFTPECDLDAGGLPLIWLTGVTAPESIRFLLSIAKNGTNELLMTQAATTAIGLHADPAADNALEELAAPNQPETLRRQAIFWLGNSRGRRGFEVISRIVREDSSDKIRKHAVFALTMSKEPEALSTLRDAIANDPETEVKKRAVFALTQMPNGGGVPLLIQVARTNPIPEVRKQAVFWLGRSRDTRALAFIEDVLK
jgi:HEAT repeat protein